MQESTPIPDPTWVDWVNFAFMAIFLFPPMFLLSRASFLTAGLSDSLIRLYVWAGGSPKANEVALIPDALTAALLLTVSTTFNVLLALKLYGVI